MKVHNAGLSPLNSDPESSRKSALPVRSAGPVDEMHLSELVRTLRSLAGDSPERQARIEQIARAYASGAYQPDAGATASRIVDDGLKYR